MDVLRLPGGVRDGSGVVELSQKTFCPLYARPIEWLAEGVAVEGGAAAEAEAALAARFLAMASELRLVPDDKAAELDESLLVEQDDFCGELSGGQRVKLALIRSGAPPLDVPAPSSSTNRSRRSTRPPSSS